MSLDRDQVIKTLAVLAGPLGPPVEPLANLEARLDFQARWIDAGGVELLGVIIDLIASPPSPEHLPLHPAHLDEWTWLLTEIAGTLGKRYPEFAIPRLLPLLADERTRSTALHILETLGDSRLTSDDLT
jgi:hypothetical protein